MGAPAFDLRAGLETGLSSGRLLLIDDDPDYAAVFDRLLGQAGFVVVAASAAQAGMELARAGGFDAVCLDLGLPDMDGLSVQRELRKIDPLLPIVILTGDSAVGSVVAAMHQGAYDYLVKNVDRTKLVTTMKNAVERRRLESRVEELQKSSSNGQYGIVGGTQAMRALFAQIERVASSNVTVAVVGESGSGKELVAAAVHEAGPRKSGPFVALNCAAIPDSLQEAELFGHEKGAFTGALTRRVGRLEQAHGGTLFLDEVAELSLSLQAKLLRALQERRVTRVGGATEIPVDFRLVTATHKDLAQEVAAGRFREDLYYRLVVFELRVPPLRERTEDIPLLAHHFLARFPDEQGRTLRLAPEALAAFLEAPWRGNVRELQNAIQHAAVVAHGGVIHVHDLPSRLRSRTWMQSPSGRGDSIEPAPPPGATVVAPAAPMHDPPLPKPAEPSAPHGPAATSSDPASGAVRLPPITLEELERLAIVQAIERHGGNLSAAIRELGLGRTTLYRKLEQYGLR